MRMMLVVELAGNDRRRASAARRLNRDEVMQIWRLGGYEDFVSE